MSFRDRPAPQLAAFPYLDCDGLTDVGLGLRIKASYPSN